MTVYADLHVHLGGIKISASRDLTVAGILRECREVKGIGLVGIVDAAAPPALAELEALAEAGELAPLPGGGLMHRDQVALLPGCEVEVFCGAPLHLLVFLPGLREMREFSRWQRADARVKNNSLSSQRHYVDAATVVRRAAHWGGIVVPAHAFTPWKSILAAAGSVGAVIPPELWPHVPAVELGLSADTELADRIPELQAFAYIADSDAHSLGKIAREYNALRLEAPSLQELTRALRGEAGRAVEANYGLDPRLGKYHRTYCLTCDRRVEGEPPVTRCDADPGHRIVFGVLDRIVLLGGGGPRRKRPPYVHQVPLEFVPGLGRRAIGRLIGAFGSEMGVLHRATRQELTAVVGERLAALIDDARSGRLSVEAGAGGLYGRILVD